MNKKVDLHIHSYASDGQWSAKELLENIDKNDINMFAITDHDEIGCVGEMAELVKDRDDINYIKAVEISSIYKGDEHHILTYNIDEDDAGLIEILETNRLIRDTYNDKLILFLAKKHKTVSLDDYKTYDYNPYIGGWYTYSYLIDRGVITDLNSYFECVVGYEADKLFPDPAILVPKLKALGYLVILAHPPAYVKGDLYKVEDLDYWRAIGIDGFECYTQYLKDQANSAYYVDYCRKNKLKITGGSDCHGGFAGRRLGFPMVTMDMIEF